MGLDLEQSLQSVLCAAVFQESRAPRGREPQQTTSLTKTHRQPPIPQISKCGMVESKVKMPELFMMCAQY